MSSNKYLYLAIGFGLLLIPFAVILVLLIQEKKKEQDPNYNIATSDSFIATRLNSIIKTFVFV